MLPQRACSLACLAFCCCRCCDRCGLVARQAACGAAPRDHTTRAYNQTNHSHCLPQLKEDYQPGNLFFDPLGLLKDKSEEEIFELQTKELNNVSRRILTGCTFFFNCIHMWMYNLFYCNTSMGCLAFQVPLPALRPAWQRSCSPAACAVPCRMRSLTHCAGLQLLNTLPQYPASIFQPPSLPFAFHRLPTQHPQLPASLLQGRLAMLAIAGFVLQELVPPHREIFEHLALYAEREILLEIEDLDPALKDVVTLPVIPGQ